MIALVILLIAIFYDIYALTTLILAVKAKQHFYSSGVPIISLIGYMVALQLTKDGFLVSFFIDLIMLTIFHILVYFVVPVFIYRPK